MGDVFAFEFMRDALAAGTLVALLAGATGYFVVLRGQGFASHMLSQIGFPGAAGAILLHLPPAVGLIAFCAAGALGVGLRPGGLDTGRRTDSAAVGGVLAFSLALGLLFFRLYSGSGQAVYSFLFGSILGITTADVGVMALTTALALAVLAVIARPLLFASVDAASALARGVPVRALSALFLLLLALAVAEAVQVVGTLLVFALLVTPGAVTRELTARPWAALALSVALSLAVVWLGLLAAYFADLPAGFAVTTAAFAAYLVARGGRALAAIR